MHIADIQKFLDTKTSEGNEYVRISFKKRATVHGIFLRDNRDYSDLKAKNFWRIVPESQIEAWKESKSILLTRLFQGSDFSRLALGKETA
jgi:hypothetical protein